MTRTIFKPGSFAVMLYPVCGIPEPKNYRNGVMRPRTICPNPISKSVLGEIGQLRKPTTGFGCIIHLSKGQENGI